MEQLKNFLSWFRRLFIDIKYKIKGIKNIFIWAPILIEDRQWDHTFILTIWKKKFELMEKYFRKYGHHVGANEDADNIRIAINVIDRLIKDEYMDRAFVPHVKKYGESHMIFEGNRLNIVHDNEPNNEKEKQKERKLFLQCSNHENYLRKQDMEFLFKHLSKHMLSWWD